MKIVVGVYLQDIYYGINGIYKSHAFYSGCAFPGEICHLKKTCSTPSFFGSGIDIWLKGICMTGTFFAKCFGIMVKWN